MKLPIYQVDAFTDSVFHGNPAAVCPLDAWLPDATLQAIAAENNLAETAFFVQRGERYALRWFTPACEVDLCGHATLASAHVITTLLRPGVSHIEFDSRSGLLTADVNPNSGEICLDFPADKPRPVAAPANLATILRTAVESTLTSRIGYLLVQVPADAVRKLSPDMQQLGALDCTGVIVTARGLDCDFVSRFFTPQLGVPEDPVTGSAHCVLTPYWAERLGKTVLHARQLSARGGVLRCELRGDRVALIGHAVTYLQGSIEVPTQVAV
jgi:PhzF family phenazine biosynthesis protein